MTSPSLSLDRYVVAAAVVLTAVLFTSRAADPVNVVKLTALLLGALVLLGSALYRCVRYRVVLVPSGAAGWVAVTLVLALVVSALTAPVLQTAVLGAYGRNSGLLAYLAGIILLLVSLRAFPRPHTGVLLGGVVFAGLFTATYGLLQRAGIDSIPWNNPFNPVIAAMGNPNFASGYLGVAASVGVGAALWPGWAIGWRALSGVTAVLCLVAAALSSSVQGPIAAASGLLLVGLTVILGLTPRLRHAGLAIVGLATTTGLALLLLGAAKAGPAAAIFGDAGSRARVFYWQAALDMFRDAPLLGVGLDQYGNFWRTSRSPASVDFLGGPSFSDAAHSVPLQFLAQGGVLLGAAYLVFLGVTAHALFRGLVRLHGPDRQLLGAVGAGWVAYQVQSAVSIDQVPLIVLHFVLAGAVLAVAGMSGLREVRLPGAPVPRAAHSNDAGARRRAAAAPVDRTLNGTDLSVLTLAAVGLLSLSWFALLPLRANVAVGDGDRALQRGDGNAALVEYQRATALVSGSSVYWGKQGSLYDQVEQPQAALAAYREAAQRDPYDVNAVRAAATRAESAGDLDAARRLFDLAVRRDPLNPQTIVAGATFELRHSGAAKALDLLEQAVERTPGDGALWASLGDARLVLRQPDTARQAYERALELEPGQPTAVAGLQKLDAGQ